VICIPQASRIFDRKRRAQLVAPLTLAYPAEALNPTVGRFLALPKVSATRDIRPGGIHLTAGEYSAAIYSLMIQPADIVVAAAGQGRCGRTIRLADGRLRFWPIAFLRVRRLPFTWAPNLTSVEPWRQARSPPSTIYRESHHAHAKLAEMQFRTHSIGASPLAQHKQYGVIRPLST